MGLIVKPNTFASGGTIVSSQVNANFDVIYTEINGNLDNSNFKVGANLDGAKFLNTSIDANAKLIDATITDAKMNYTSVKVLRTSGITGNGLKVARGSKAFTFGGAGTVTITITFSTDSDDGNPAFSATPRATFGIRHAATANNYTAQVTAISSTSITIQMTSSLGTDATSGNLDWIAIGLA